MIKRKMTRRICIRLAHVFFEPRIGWFDFQVRLIVVGHDLVGIRICRYQLDVGFAVPCRNDIAFSDRKRCSPTDCAR